MKISTIHYIVCKHFEVELDYIFNPTRKRPLLTMRQIFHYLAKKHTRHTLSYIGRYYSDVTHKVYNHATVLHSAQTIQDYMFSESEMRETIEILEAIIKQSQTTDIPTLEDHKELIIKDVNNAQNVNQLFEFLEANSKILFNIIR